MNEADLKELILDQYDQHHPDGDMHYIKEALDDVIVPIFNAYNSFYKDLYEDYFKRNKLAQEALDTIQESNDLAIDIVALKETINAQEKRIDSLEEAQEIRATALRRALIENRNLQRQLSEVEYVASVRATEITDLQRQLEAATPAMVPCNHLSPCKDGQHPAAWG